MGNRPDDCRLLAAPGECPSRRPGHALAHMPGFEYRVVTQFRTKKILKKPHFAVSIFALTTSPTLPAAAPRASTARSPAAITVPPTWLKRGGNISFFILYLMFFLPDSVHFGVEDLAQRLAGVSVQKTVETLQENGDGIIKSSVTWPVARWPLRPSRQWHRLAWGEVRIHFSQEIKQKNKLKLL